MFQAILSSINSSACIYNKLAAPPTLSVQSVDLTYEEGEYQAVITFATSKNQPLGALQFIATIQGNSGANILDFWPARPPFLSGDNSKQIAENGKQARLGYQLMGAGSPSIKIVTSEPATVVIQGNHELEAFQIELK